LTSSRQRQQVPAGNSRHLVRASGAAACWPR
jgi:hypothetical protein